MGYSRQPFYEIRRNFQAFGAQGLLDRLPGTKGPHSNRLEETVESAILDYSLKHPSHGSLKVAQQLVYRAFRSVSVAFAASGADTNRRHATSLLG